MLHSAENVIGPVGQEKNVYDKQRRVFQTNLLAFMDGDITTVA